MVICGYFIFRMLFTRYSGIAGYGFCLLIALCCTTFLQTATGMDNRQLPSGGPIRMIWTYATLGFIAYAYSRFKKQPTGAFDLFLSRRQSVLWLLSMLCVV